LRVARELGAKNSNFRATYERHMASPHWRARRDAYFKLHPYVCHGCGTDEALHLHHVTYERMGTERDADLMPLCQSCHALVHEYHRIVGGNLCAATRHVVGALRRTVKPAPRLPKRPVGRNNPVDAVIGHWALHRSREERTERQAH